jgi:hypothetical protein
MLLRGFGAVLSISFLTRDRSTFIQVASVCGGAYYHFALYRSRLGNALKRLRVGHLAGSKVPPFDRALCTCRLTRAVIIQRRPRAFLELFKFDLGGA